MRPIVALFVTCFLSLLSHITIEAKSDPLRYFKIQEVEENNTGEQVKGRLSEATSADAIATEPVISPKDAVYRLSYAEYETTWKQFKLDHNRSYESAREEQMRFAVFMDNVKIIERHNWQFHNGLTTYWMDINQFSDWTFEEWRAYMSPIEKIESSTWENNQSLDEEDIDKDVPISIDWRHYGYVTYVKDQGGCGSCFAFAAAGAIEGQWFKKTGELIPLSEQQIVDCSKKFGNHGCKGGRSANSFTYVASEGGIEKERDYPYVGEESYCTFQPTKVRVRISGYRIVSPGKNETVLRNAVGTIGPLYATFAVSNNFKLYKGGIFEDTTCKEINHGVLLIGYGNFPGQDYWIIKNSWGINWGAGGYGYIARNKGNVCQIATHATYPIV